MTTEIITMRRRERDDGPELRQVGDFEWITAGASILVWFPSLTGKPYVCQRLLRLTDGTDWTNPGDVDSMAEWDGDKDRPTLYPSIQIRELVAGDGDKFMDGWHGWIHKGLMGTDLEVLEKMAK